MRVWLLILVLIASSAFAKWEYSDTTSKMDDMKTAMASVMSDEIRGGGEKSKAILMLAKRGDGDTIVTVGVQQGRFDCREDQCEMRFRFDSANAITWDGAPVNGSLVRVVPRIPFLEKVREAKRLLIEARVNGSTTVMEFDVSGLVWP